MMVLFYKDQSLSFLLVLFYNHFLIITVDTILLAYIADEWLVPEYESHHMPDSNHKITIK